MLNYSNLNDVEFEYLCKDIMSRMLNVKLERFGSGRDDGIDLTDNSYRKSIIVQVKHYTKTDVWVSVEPKLLDSEKSLKS